jgi:hypothetical protein
LHVTTRAVDARVEITITSGIAEGAERELLVVEPFAPSEGAWPTASLQLVRAYRSITAHQGSVVIREGGGGVQVTIVLPLFADSADAVAAESQVQARVVIVAADTALARLMSAILETVGIVPLVLPTWEATVGSPALDTADLLVIDLGGSPESFARAEATIPETLPVVLVRNPGHDPGWSRHRVASVGRPFTAEEFLFAVQRSLEGA